MINGDYMPLTAEHTAKFKYKEALDFIRVLLWLKKISEALELHNQHFNT
jgi:hypothetical protein